MKLIKEVISPKEGFPHRYLLLTEVSDDDAYILELCNMHRMYYESNNDEIELWTME